MAYKNQNQSAFRRSSYRKPEEPVNPVLANSDPEPPAAPAHCVITGRKDLWKSLQTIKDNAGNTKTTRILELDMGVVINTCTRGPAGMCEALQFIAGATAKNFEGGES